MSEPVRILLRVVGLVLFLGSLAAVVFIVAVGPDEVGRQMGRECRTGGNQLGPAQHCTWQDVLGILKALPFLTLVGGVLVLVSRRDSVEAEVRSGRGSRIRTIVTLMAILVIPINFVGVFVYAAGYTIKTQVDVTKKILDDAPPPPDLSKKAKRAKPAADAPAPRGLARGSLLRAGAFRRAMVELRRTAPAGARISSLRVAADRIDAEVLAGGRAVTLRKPWDGRATVESRSAATGGEETLVAFAELDPSAPQRAAIAGARSAGASTRDVDYLVLFDAVGLRWNTFLEDGGRMVSVSPDGREVL